MQINQYEQLGSYIESTRKLNHDIRHHLITLQGMAFIEKSSNGFLSSKRNNKAGIGLSSIKFIAEKYNGSVEFSGEGKIFKSNIFLDID